MFAPYFRDLSQSIHRPLTSPLPRPLKRVSFVASAALLLALPVTAQSEVRGTWLTTTGPDYISSGFNTENSMSRIRDIGMNTVYVEAWKNGYTNFPSQTMQNLVGIDRQPFLGSRDLVEETNIHAHRNGLINVAWFEYGFSSQFIGNGGFPSNPISSYMRNRGWLLQDQSGNYGNASNGFAWMNPAVPEVRQFLVDITMEAINNYDLDGIQFDDRLAWPREFGWDTTTANLYQQETGRSLPSNVNDSNFRTWRQGKVQLFAQELNDAIKAERPDFRVSVSPSVTGFSDTNFNAKWSDWVDAGLFDEYVPQVYRSTFASFNSTLPANITALEPDVEKGVIGIRFNGTGGNTPLNDVLNMIALTRSTANGELSGHSLWYNDQVLANETALTNFYNGYEENPFYDADWRPDALEGSQAQFASDPWLFEDVAPGGYRLVAEIAGTWEVFDEITVTSTSDLLIQIPGAASAELLIDRRVGEIIPVPTTTALLLPAIGLLMHRRRA